LLLEVEPFLFSHQRKKRNVGEKDGRREEIEE
jgi:hypothetical protein